MRAMTQLRHAGMTQCSMTGWRAGVGRRDDAARRAGDAAVGCV